MKRLRSPRCANRLMTRMVASGRVTLMRIGMRERHPICTTECEWFTVQPVLRSLQWAVQVRGMKAQGVDAWLITALDPPPRLAHERAFVRLERIEGRAHSR